MNQLELVRSYYKKGAVDIRKPIYILQEVTVKPPTPIAFSIDDEVQIKGAIQADKVTTYGWDEKMDDLHDDTYGDNVSMGEVVPFNQAEYDKIHREGYAWPEEYRRVRMEELEKEKGNKKGSN